MTSNATLTRGTETVTFPIQEESGSTPISRGIGAPSHTLHPNGRVNPRSGARAMAASETITLATQLFADDGGYTTALDLADMIKAHSGGDNLLLNVPFQEYDSDLKVFPAAGSDEALSLEYPAGSRKIVTSLKLTRVGVVLGTSSDFRVDTPRDGGSGSIELYGDNNTVDFKDDNITVARSVGRPNSEISRDYNNYPRVTDQRKSSYDAFDLTLTHVQNAAQKTRDLRDMILERRGYKTMTLDFNGTYGMGQFNVMPSGGNALQTARIAGRKGDEHQRVPTLKLRVVSE